MGNLSICWRPQGLVVFDGGISSHLIWQGPNSNQPDLGPLELTPPPTRCLPGRLPSTLSSTTLVRYNTSTATFQGSLSIHLNYCNGTKRTTTTNALRRAMLVHAWPIDWPATAIQFNQLQLSLALSERKKRADLVEFQRQPGE